MALTLEEDSCVYVCVAVPYVHQLLESYVSKLFSLVEILESQLPI
jgi:hypothetical protein